MAEGTVGKLNIELAVDMSQLQSGMASAQVTMAQFSSDAGKSFEGVGGEAQKAGQQVGGIGNSAQTAGQQMDKMGAQGSSAISAIGTALVAVGFAKGMSFIYDGFKNAVDASVEFESAMAGVAKTTDLTDAELKEMSADIRTLATVIPATTTEIAGVAEAAGQLGIQGSGNILEFTETMTMLGTATNMTADEAATMLAQFANITQLAPSLYSNMGSAITDLGNSTATTEKQITDMAQGIAASATNANIAEPAILGIAAATASVGIEAAAGATSWSTFIQEMQKAVETGEDLEEWAAVANMTAEEFARLWGQDAAKAIDTWIRGLGEAGEQGRSMTSTLDSLGISETRQVRMLQSLANAGDLLSNALETGNVAWAENTALAKEAATRYATTESQARLLANRQEILAQTVGDQLNPLYSNLLEIGKDVTDFFQEMFEQNELLGPALASVATGATVAGGAFLAYSVAMKLKSAADVAATATQHGLNAAMNANPVFLVITGVAALTAALSVFALSLADADAETKALTANTESLITAMDDNVVSAYALETQFSAQAATTETLITRLGELASITGIERAEQAEMQNIVASLNEIYPELGVSIDTVADAEGNFVAELKDANGELIDNVDVLKDATAEMREYQEQAAKAGALSTLYQDLGDAQEQVALTQAKMSGTLNQYDEKTQEVMQTLAEMPDVFANLIMENMGWDKEMRDAVESLDELEDGMSDLEEQIVETEGAVKELTGQDVALTAVLNETTGAIEYFVDEAGNMLNANGELILSTVDLNARYGEMYERLNALGITADEYISATQGMTEAEVAEYESSLALGDQYDKLLELYGSIGITRAAYIEQTAGMSEAQIEEYNSVLLQEAAMATMQERYKTLYEAAQESLNGQYELWDKLDNEVTISAEKIAEATASQGTSYESYAANLEALKERGITAAQLLAMGFGEYSEEGAQALAGLAEASDTKLSAAIDNFETTGVKSNELATALAELHIEAETAFEGVGAAAETESETYNTSMDSVQDKSGETQDALSGDLSTMESDVETAMDNILGYVVQLNESLPLIKIKFDPNITVPTFSMSGEFNYKTGAVPSVAVGASNIQWYDQGGLFDTPQIIGVAERRPEFVGAAEDLNKFISGAVSDAFRAYDNPAFSQSTYSGDTNITMPITFNVNGNMTDAQMDKAVYEIRKEFGRLVTA